MSHERHIWVVPDDQGHRSRRRTISPTHRQRDEGNFREYLQSHVDTAQSGMFNALDKEQEAMRLLREAEFEKEIHGRALTAAQLRRAGLSDRHVEGQRLGEANDTIRSILPGSMLQQRLVGGVQSPYGSASIVEANKSAKTKKKRQQVIAITRPAGVKNIWGQTAWS